MRQRLWLPSLLVCLATLSRSVNAGEAVNVADAGQFDAAVANGAVLNFTATGISFADPTRAGVVLGTDTAMAWTAPTDGVVLVGGLENPEAAWGELGEKGRLVGLFTNNNLAVTFDGNPMGFTDFRIVGTTGDYDGETVAISKGGVFWSAGGLTLKNAVNLAFRDNQVFADADPSGLANAWGGALAAEYDIALTGAKGLLFGDNIAAAGFFADPSESGADYEYYAVGGAIAARNGSVDLAESDSVSFTGNQAHGPSANGFGAYAKWGGVGGAVYGESILAAGALNLRFADNEAVGGDAMHENSMASSSGVGGALAAKLLVDLSNASVSFTGNRAFAGDALGKGEAGSYTGGSGVGGAIAALDHAMYEEQPPSESNVNLAGATGFFTDNWAVGGLTPTTIDTTAGKIVANVSGLGGAIASRGAVDLSGATLEFAGNRAIAGGFVPDSDENHINAGTKGSSGLGGAIFARENLATDGATLIFRDNAAYGAHATGKDNDSTSSGLGGAIYLRALEVEQELHGAFTGLSAVFENNTAAGGDAHNGARTSFSGNGGAFSQANQKLTGTADNLTFRNNSALGGSAYGDAGMNYSAALASGWGGAIVVGGEGIHFTSATNLLFEGNRAVGGDAHHVESDIEGYGFGWTSSSGLGGAVFANNLVILQGARNVVFRDNLAQAGDVYGFMPMTTEHESGQGGAIFTDGDIEITGTGILFENNTAHSGRQEFEGYYSSGNGGALYVGKNLTIANTGEGDIVFRGNSAVGTDEKDVTSGLGGAVFMDGLAHPFSTVALSTVEGGGDIVFQDNTASGLANDFYFSNPNAGDDDDYNTTYAVDIAAAAGTSIELHGGLSSQGRTGIFEDNAFAFVNLEKTGAGTFVLGGVNNLDGMARITIKEGTLVLDPGTVINMNDDEIAGFTMDAGTTLVVSGAGGTAINAGDIKLDAGTKVELDFGYTLANSAILSLNADESLDNQSSLIDYAQIGAFDYYNPLRWENTPDGMNLVANPTGRRVLNTARAGVSTMTGAIALAAWNPTSDGLFRRMEQRLGSMSRPFALVTAGGGGSEAACEPLNDLWATPIYVHVKQNDRVGYDLDSVTGLVGYDRKIGERFFVGGGFSVGGQNYRSRDNHLTGTDVAGFLYAGALLPAQIELGVFGQFAWTDMDQTRRAQGERWKKSYDATRWSLGVELGRSFTLCSNWMLRPFASYEFMRQDVDGLTERANGGLWALHFSPYHNKMHRVRAGLGTSWLSSRGISVDGNLYYAGSYGDRTGETQAYFVNDETRSRFTATGDKLDRHALGVGLGMGIPLGRNASMRADYDLKVGKEHVVHQANLGVQFKF